ncbi:hypothetical protein C8046_06690 [Serinibacter arcticus]|uniref:VOC domain-containing protein n=1 Tax=Serinibacter arcticus TaxID=1655435 RepID=A0A2U1ZTS2_9MICO|nr:VOC family protein [Serinibacter arcticus]PWD50384.1 hypothetical protein C8046_06690 [Serinibacter arcticus]
MTETSATDDGEDYGTVTWWEIPATNLPDSVRFYREAFDWEFEAMDADYEIVLHRGRMVGGIYAHDTDTGQLGDGTRLTINVADLEASLSRVTAAGGRVVHGRAAIGEGFGWWALFTDPSGLTIGLASPHPPVED